MTQFLSLRKKEEVLSEKTPDSISQYIKFPDQGHMISKMQSSNMAASNNQNMDLVREFN